MIYYGRECFYFEIPIVYGMKKSIRAKILQLNLFITQRGTRYRPYVKSKQSITSNISR